MAFNWKNYLSFARCIAEGLEGIDKEACQRSAVSRAYYAAFCHVCKIASERENFPRKNDATDHGKLIGHLKGRHKIPIAHRLGSLRDLRNKCDYKDVVKNLQTICSNAFNDCTEIFKVYR